MSHYFQRIMIVDDTYADRFILRKSLEKIELAEEIIEAESGMQALDKLTAVGLKNEHFPELIFLDIHMPSMDGFQFLDVISQLSHEYSKRCRIIMVCSVDDAAERARAFNYENVVGYYLKPVTADMLLQLAERLRHTHAS
jgi:CheY-like chemotaxis protein